MATTRRQRKRRPGTALLMVAVVVTVGLTAWGVLHPPARTSVAQRRVSDGVVVPLPEGRASSRWWRLELALDPHLRPGPVWVAHAGDPEGDGHSLRWHPDSLTLQLLRRRPPVTGSGALSGPQLLLSSVTLDHAPEGLHWLRHDHRHRLEVEGETVAEVDDLLAAPGTRSWTLVPEGDLGLGSVVVHDDVHLQRAVEPTGREPDPELLRDEDARLMVYRALNSPIGSEVGLARREAAAHALTVIGSESPAGRQLVPWLAWDRARRALLANPPIPTLGLGSGIRELTTSATEPAAGLGLLVLPGLTWRATRQPMAAMPARQWIEQRREWLRALGRCSTVRTGRESLDWELALLGHLATCLAGDELEPTPTEAPRWITTRWRLAAGFPLPEDGPIEAPPLPDPGTPSIRGATIPLLQHARIDRAGTPLRGRILNALDRHRPDEALAALRDAPARERVLLLGVLACHGLVSDEQARSALAETGEAGVWKETHPLAYAIDRLLAHRSGAVPPPNIASEPGTPSQLEREVPEALGRYRRLLSGKPGATLLVFAFEDDTLPPLHALAAALALQEVAGLEVDWDLLGTAPALDLPLHLLRPVENPEATP